MNRIWLDISIAAIAWGSGWLYGSAGAWNEGYKYGRATMQLLLKGHPVTAEKVRDQLPPQHKPPTYYKAESKAKLWDHEEMTPQPFKQRLSMIQGGKK